MKKAVVYFFLIFLVSSCSPDSEEIKAVSVRSNVNIEKGKEIEIHYSAHGEMKVKALAKSVTRFTGDRARMEFPDGIKVYFYNQDHDVQTMMSAGYATAVDGQGSMTAQKNVEVINEKGEKLNCEELVWDEQKRIIYSNSFVKISTNDEVIMGKGLVSNETFTDYQIKNITGIVKVKSSEVE